MSQFAPKGHTTAADLVILCWCDSMVKASELEKTLIPTESERAADVA